MKKLFLLFLAFASGSLFAQVSTGDAAYANMQRSVGGIVQSVAVSRGASVSDPRTYATLFGMGKAASASVAVGAVGTGLLVTTGAVTAPAWGTILAIAAVSGAVSYGVSLGIDKLQKWLFGSNDVSSAASGWEATFNCTSSNDGDPSDCVDTGIPGRTCAVVSHLGGRDWIIQCRAFDGTYNPPQTLASAVNDLPATALTSPVDYSSMALIVNDLWKKAAAEPDYQGLPFVLTQPVTATEVQTWALANPAVYPKVADLLAPVTDTATGLAPSSTASASSSVSPVTTPVNPYATPQQTATSSSVTVALDLGANPGIPTPALDASDFLQPLLNMLPGWRSALFTAQGQCMKPSFDLRPVIPSVIEMHSHCDLFEQNRALLSAVMAVVWLMLAAFIVLGA